VNQQQYKIPRYLNEPKRFVIFTIDELIGFMAALILFGWVLNALVVGLVIGSAIVAGLKKLKGEQGLTRLYALIYWYLPPIFPYRCLPASHQRHWVG